MREMRAQLRAEPVLLALVGLATVAWSAFSLAHWLRFGSAGFDLGIFDQTVWHYSRFEVPENTVRGLDNIWGDHFSPILVLLAPLYWLWDDARVLLLAQVVLLTAAAFPIFFYARPRVGRVPAHLLAAAYLVFWGVQSGIEHDFHEVAFVPLLLGSLLLAADHRRWRTFFALLLALLCVKEDQAIVAVFLGLYLLTGGHRRQGAATIAAGLVWYGLVVGLLIPHFSPTGEYGYFSYSKFGDSGLSALAHAVTHPGLVVETLFDDPVKRGTLVDLFVPFLGLALCSRLSIVLLPLIVQRFLSDNALLWSTEYHYTLPIAAVLFFATADGLSTVARLWTRRGGRVRIVIVAAAAVVFGANVYVMTTHEPNLTGITRAATYRAPDGADGAAEAIAAVPDDASVAAQSALVPRLSQRQVIFEAAAGRGPADYVVANAFAPGRVSRYLGAVGLEAYVPVVYANGWLTLRAENVPGAERTPLLAPVDPARAARLQDEGLAWGLALTDYVARLRACGVVADRAACVKPLGAAFGRSQGALIAALEDLPDDLSPGCAALAQAATETTVAFRDTLGALRDAALTSDDAAIADGAARLRELEDENAVGSVVRFAGLCAPAA